MIQKCGWKLEVCPNPSFDPTLLFDSGRLPKSFLFPPLSNVEGKVIMSTSHPPHVFIKARQTGSQTLCQKKSPSSTTTHCYQENHGTIWPCDSMTLTGISKSILPWKKAQRQFWDTIRWQDKCVYCTASILCTQSWKLFFIRNWTKWMGKSM